MLYVSFPTMPDAQKRSQSQAQTLGCDGINTIYWWDCIALADNTAAICIDPSRPEFDAVHPKGIGLSKAEQDALKSRSQMGTLLPDIIPQPTFSNRFTSSQLSSISSAAKTDTSLNDLYNKINSASQVDLQDPQTIAFINKVSSIIDAVSLQTITAAQSVAVQPAPATTVQ